ncbi:DNA polymerase Y family protein [Mucilaginibacter sp. 21P]|uniref:Y-family DNA polymerase n=1 Tax=Mucilaginibacter sp. 21P TaxID=2778902 RepID=UPI001C586E53|nr:DNA polymerase Y family protein [Mucilaginibacter sp. 21P]QXV64309.1 DNA polymerase Y family protein [Mucilaginibacter sp. 21P]
MGRRYVSLWFRHLLTDWLTLRQPELKDVPFILVAPEKNRLIVKAANHLTESYGISTGMAAADARAVVPDLKVLDAEPGKAEEILKKAAAWCIRYSPLIAVDADGLLLDITGCTHLWGSEKDYLRSLIKTLITKGYDVRGAMADTVGLAWAVARYGKQKPIITTQEHQQALLTLPPEALRIESETVDLLYKLGFFTVGQLMGHERSALRRRFGNSFLLRLHQALGNVDEPLQYIHPVEAYHVRLPFLEPIRTAEVIEKAINTLLKMMCERLSSEGNGLRKAVLKGYRVDGHLTETVIGTNKPSNNAAHLLKLFALKIPNIEPALGIELFTLDAFKVEEVEHKQENLWLLEGSDESTDALAGLLDRIGNKIGAQNIHRYLPQASYWPERSIKQALSLTDQPEMDWNNGRPRPSLLLKYPQRIEVMALLPDDPPKHFVWKGQKHIIKKADDAERIEPEWWQHADRHKHRDYYMIEDEKGCRYWVFRSGHHQGGDTRWYLHGFFA